jgi:hypothetical protein
MFITPFRLIEHHISHLWHPVQLSGTAIRDFNIITPLLEYQLVAFISVVNIMIVIVIVIIRAIEKIFSVTVQFEKS